MKLKIALTGNPNCGKTTMFNLLTGANQYVGNWPGVTVEKKEGRYKGNSEITVTDLPGIYSLSPYSPEEVVSRDYLMDDGSNVVLNIVDSSNLERNLYLTTQLMELGKPVVVALNMIDVVKKTGGSIDSKKLSAELGCKVVETSALRGEGVKKAVEVAVFESKNTEIPVLRFSSEVEKAVEKASELVPSSIKRTLLRWFAIKILERDKIVLEKLSLNSEQLEKAEKLTQELEKSFDDDIESIITNERYNLVTKITKICSKKSTEHLTASDKIDRIVTNRFLGIPIFLFVMWLIYYVSVTTVGTWMTDWASDSFVAGIMEYVQTAMENAGVNAILIDCIVNGIIGGLGAILGFVPQMAILFLLLSVVEDCGYMVRIAFVMDRIFRRFGLSGKSFIPLLISSGCGVPGIMASKTIENNNDRRLTIMTATWIPCGAKLPVIALMAGVLAGRISSLNSGNTAALMYAAGLGSVLVSAVILKKTKPFHGDAAPFVMELPRYHMPQPATVLLHTWERLRGFIVKAGTILFLACIVLWFLSSYGFGEEGFGLVEAPDSLMAFLGNFIRYIFIPLGFGGAEGGWQAAAATISGFSAKEAIVGTMGVLANVDEELVEDAGAVAVAVSSWFPTAAAAMSFLLFNLLDSPCMAAVSTMANELKDRRWFWFSIIFQNLWAYVISLCVYNYMMLALGVFTFGTVLAIIFTIIIAFMLFRRNPYKN